MVVACVYDLNYKASFEFLDKLNVMKILMDNCSKYLEESLQNVYKKEIIDYIKERV
jgi:hypothetical protein